MLAVTNAGRRDVAFTLGQSVYFAVALVILIGIPISVVPFVRRGPKEDLARPLKCLHWGFWLAILAFGVAMALEGFFPSAEPRSSLLDLAADLLLATFYAFTWLYWTSVATLARRRGRSALLWVALGLVTLAIGFVVTYVVIGKDARAALHPERA
jgi:hypothetical protein